MGWNNQVVTLLVVSEAGAGYSGIFVYSPAPGPGNLILSIASIAGTDPYGNYYPAGFTDQAGGSSNAEVNIRAGEITFTDTADNGWGIYPEVVASIPYLTVFTPGSGVGQVFITETGYVLANEPGVANTPENWHYITLDTGWTTLAGHTPPMYRLLPTNDVEYAGFAQHANFAVSTALNSSNPLPAAYRPANVQYIGRADLNRSGWEVTTTGIVTCEPVAAGNTFIELAGGICPLGV